MKKHSSIVQAELSGPALPGGRLTFVPVLPASGLLEEIKKVSRQRINLRPGQLFYLQDRALLYGTIGSPACIMMLERVRMIGLKEILVLSYCGSLSPQLTIGQAFIPLQALSQEGTSRHYLPKRDGLYYPTEEMILRLTSFLKRNQLSYSSGCLASTDAPFRETLPWLKKMQKRGVQAVDMEMSAILAFSRFYGIKAAGLFLISDQLSERSWSDGFNSPALKDATLKYFKPVILSEFI